MPVTGHEDTGLTTPVGMRLAVPSTSTLSPPPVMEEFLMSIEVTNANETLLADEESGRRQLQLECSFDKYCRRINHTLGEIQDLMAHLTRSITMVGDRLAQVEVLIEANAQKSRKDSCITRKESGVEEAESDG